MRRPRQRGIRDFPSVPAGESPRGRAQDAAFAAGRVPTVAAKANFGNLGAASGLVECVTSLLAMRHGTLFPLLNYETADPDCGILPARRGAPAGDICLSSAVTPQGQAGALVLRGWPATA